MAVSFSVREEVLGKAFLKNHNPTKATARFLEVRSHRAFSKVLRCRGGQVCTPVASTCASVPAAPRAGSPTCQDIPDPQLTAHSAGTRRRWL